MTSDGLRGITETCLGKTNTYNYNYDLSGRLIQVQRNDTTISKYFFDDNGNRISYISNGDTVHSVYDDQNRMLAYGNTVYQYNAQGSLTTKIEGQDTTRYTYDLMGNLLAVSLPNGDEIEYLIDPQNRRIGKILNGVIIKKWIYQDQLNPVAEFDGNDNLIACFVYGSKAHVPDYIMKGDTTYRIITDHLGSVRAVMNVVTGEVVQEISYNEFGVVLYNSNPGFQPFAYAGGLYDMQTGLVRFGARDYDADVGRWTAKDPDFFTDSFTDLYSFCDCDPINYYDVSGTSKAKVIEKGGYTIIKYAKDLHHGGPHYHIFDKGGNRLIGKVATNGKILSGKVPKSALKILAKSGGLTLSAALAILADPGEANAGTITGLFTKWYLNGDITWDELVEAFKESPELLEEIIKIIADENKCR